MLGVPIGVTGGKFAMAATPVPDLPRGKGEQCVEPTDVIRREHMRFLKHHRDETVHRGIRTTRHSLVECVSCHVQRDPGGGFLPVNGEGQFCQECHSYTGVKMDCFQCHATKPRPDSITRRQVAE